MHKTFPLERGVHHNKGYCAILFTKCQFDSQPLIYFMWNNRSFYNLDLFFHVAAREMLSVVSKAQKVNADRLVELRDAQG